MKRQEVVLHIGMTMSSITPAAFRLKFITLLWSISLVGVYWFTGLGGKPLA
jgi:hypothetical protein